MKKNVVVIFGGDSSEHDVSCLSATTVIKNMDTEKYNVILVGITKEGKWLKSNAGKTYKDAINAYYTILEEKKNGKTKIDKQFEYNTYIRDFFEDNKGKSLDDAIKCWKFKKQLKGHNKYEKFDLDILK